MIRMSHILAAALAALAFSAGTAAAQARIAAGVLECRLASSRTFIVGSVRNFNCVFRPVAGPPQRYRGTVRRLGVDLGFTRQAGLLWTVLAPTNVVGPGALDGGYVGVSASVAAGPGVGANALVGGLGNSFALQPLSIEGQRGVNLAVGVAGFELHYRP